MGSIYLVRHGLTKYNLENRFQGHLDIPLSSEGVNQAIKLQSFFENKKIDVIYSSDLKRAKDTANFISQSKKLKINILPNLREVDVGDLEGLKWEEVKKHHPIWVKAGHNDGYPGGESRKDIDLRVKQLWDYITKKHPSEEVVLLTHGGIIKALLCQILQIDNENRSRFIIDNCSITTIVIGDFGIRIKSVNTTYHLE